MYKPMLLGWLSPAESGDASHAQFRYDLLPRLWQSYAIFGGLIVAAISWLYAQSGITASTLLERRAN
jgi:hypothetical protein